MATPPTAAATEEQHKNRRRNDNNAAMHSTSFSISRSAGKSINNNNNNNFHHQFHHCCRHYYQHNLLLASTLACVVTVFLFSSLLLCPTGADAKKSSSHHYKTTAAEDPALMPAAAAGAKTSAASAAKQSRQQQQSTASKSSSGSQQKQPAAAAQQKHSSKSAGGSSASVPTPAPAVSSSAGGPDHKFSIEDVDEEQIDEILRDNSKNLVIFFYDGRVKCPECGSALSEVEEIDDDIEATGYIEVVKTDDRRVARECGVSTFPALVYYRRKHPILYDGDFKDSEVVLRWLRAHDEVATWELNDDNFEWRTGSHSPPEGSLDWLVMFYDSEEPDCNAFVPTLETVAHKLRGLVNVGKVDTSVSDDVAERFRIDESQCPTILLFHRGKFFRYNEPAKDVRGLTAFALNKFKEQRGHRVPEPPTALEHFYEHVKERLTDAVEDNQTLTAICVGGAILIVSLCLALKAYRIRSEQQQRTTGPSMMAADGKKMG